MSDKVNVYDIVTDRIVTALEGGTVPWVKPWVGQAPTSMATLKPYRGINTMLLGFTAMAQGYESNFWGTYNQIGQQGGQVRKNEHGTIITFWKQTERPDPENPDKVKRSMFLRYFRVFNADQADWADGMPDKFSHVVNPDFEPHAEAERVATAYLLNDGPTFTEGGDSAHYRPATDTLNMPVKTAFKSEEAYYSVLFHECGHSTGAEKRLNREGVTNFDGFGTHQYSREELIAEMTAGFLCATVGIENTVEQSAAYIDGWLTTLRSRDHKLIVQAASAAAKAADYILGATDDNEEGEGE